ncbi:MAG: diacylglycerol/lipid kinase family protein [Solirubrobacterales bacterium]
MSKTMVIVNPASANGATRRKWPAVEAALKNAGITFDYEFTCQRADAAERTRNALQRGYDTIISVGGDGTTNETVNGFFAEGKPVNPNARLGLLCCGTGGDFVRSAGIPKNIEAAAQVLARGYVHPTDVGLVRFQTHEGTPGERFFINITDMGLGGDLVERVNRTSKAMGGFVSFAWAAILTIFSYRNKPLKLEIDGKPCYEGMCTVAAISNGQYFGGGMHVAPDAHLDSGQFTIVVADCLGKLEMLVAMPAIYQGTHLKHPKVKVWTGTTVRATSTDKVLLDVDGEQPGILDAEFTLIHGGINLICNPDLVCACQRPEWLAEAAATR